MAFCKYIISIWFPNAMLCFHLTLVKEGKDPKIGVINYSVLEVLRSYYLYDYSMFKTWTIMKVAPDILECLKKTAFLSSRYSMLFTFCLT